MAQNSIRICVLLIKVLFNYICRIIFLFLKNNFMTPHYHHLDTFVLMRGHSMFLLLKILQKLSQIIIFHQTRMGNKDNIVIISLFLPKNVCYDSQ